jgi:hypothetical protein
MTPREVCPQCGSPWFKRNGHIHTGKQNHRCKRCGRAFVLNPENPVITEEQRSLIERLLVERISLRGICRAMGVCLSVGEPDITTITGSHTKMFLRRTSVCASGCGCATRGSRK